MNQFPTLERLRPLLRIEVAIAVVILVVAAIWYNQSQDVSDAQDRESSLDAKLRAARADLRIQNSNDDANELRDEIARLESEQRPLSLPSRDEAMRLGQEILFYADAQQLNLPVFGREESVATLGDQDYTSIRYSLAAQGSTESLAGVLQLLRDFPTAIVQTLNFIRPPEGLNSWEMTLELDVFYGEAGT